MWVVSVSRKCEHMAMNPSALFKLAGFQKRFDKNHPKVTQFLKTVVMGGLPEGTIIEMTVTKPGEEPVTANMKVLQDDLEMLEELKNLQN